VCTCNLHVLNIFFLLWASDFFIYLCGVSVAASMLISESNEQIREDTMGQLKAMRVFC